MESDAETTMSVIYDQNNRLIFNDEGQVCLQDSLGTVKFVTLDRLPPKFLQDYFSQTLVQCRTEQVQSQDYFSPNLPQSQTEHNQSQDYFSQNPPQLQPEQDQSRDHASESRAQWTRSRIITLIEAYKEHQNLFKSTTVRNIDAWQRIAADVGEMTAKQCESKFKHLKAIYTKKKDNIGNRSSGAQAVNFEYFDEFEDIFGNDPNITPISVASSSRQHILFSGLITEDDNGPVQVSPNVSGESIERPVPISAVGQVQASSSRPQRRKRTRLEIQLEKFHVSMEQREQARERRFERFIKHQEDQSRLMCNLLEKLIDKF